jgi:hypothetical protein
MKVAVTIALLLLSISVRSAGLIGEVESDLFRRLPVPERWIPSYHAIAISSAREYPRAPFDSVEIADFIRVYGIPTFLASPKSKKGRSYLVYEMTDGCRLLVHISDEKSGGVLAAQLYRPDGKPEGPLLK